MLYSLRDKAGLRASSVVLLCWFIIPDGKLVTIKRCSWLSRAVVVVCHPAAGCTGIGNVYTFNIHFNLVSSFYTFYQRARSQVVAA